jgi:hypothetical protein
MIEIANSSASSNIHIIPTQSYANIPVTVHYDKYKKTLAINTDDQGFNLRCCG